MFVSQSQRTAAAQLALGAAVWCNSCHTIHDSEAPDCPVNKTAAKAPKCDWHTDDPRLPAEFAGPMHTLKDGQVVCDACYKYATPEYKTAASTKCSGCGRPYRGGRGWGGSNDKPTCPRCLKKTAGKPPWLDGDKKDDDKSKKDDSDGEKLKCPDCGKTYIKEKDGLHQCNTKKSSLDDEIVYQRGKKHYCQACGEWDPRYQRRRAPFKGITPHDPGTRVKASELPPGTRCADCEGDLTKESGRKHADWANDSAMLEDGDDLGGYQPVKAPDPLSVDSQAPDLTAYDESSFVPQSDRIAAQRFALTEDEIEEAYRNGYDPGEYEPNPDDPDDWDPIDNFEPELAPSRYTGSLRSPFVDVRVTGMMREFKSPPAVGRGPVRKGDTVRFYTAADCRVNPPWAVVVLKGFMRNGEWVNKVEVLGLSGRLGLAVDRARKTRMPCKIVQMGTDGWGEFVYDDEFKNY